jgi:hypothetical protein
MASKKINAPNFVDVTVAFNDHVSKNDSTISSSEKWMVFLKECGLQHRSFSRLQVSNKKKYLLAKIRYGF